MNEVGEESKVAAGEPQVRSGTQEHAGMDGFCAKSRRTDCSHWLLNIHIYCKKETLFLNFKYACRRNAEKIKTHQEMHISVNKLPHEEEKERKKKRSIVKAVSRFAAALIRVLCKNASSA